MEFFSLFFSLGNNIIISYDSIDKLKSCNYTLIGCTIDLNIKSQFR